MDTTVIISIIISTIVALAIQLQDENNVLNEELEVVTGGQRERRSHQRKVQDPSIK